MMQFFSVILTLIFFSKYCLAQYEPLFDVNAGNILQMAQDVHLNGTRPLDISIANSNDKDVNILEAACNLGLKTLVKLIGRTGLKKRLTRKGSFTLFGPTEEAFEDLPDWAQEAIKNQTILSTILKFHVLGGKVTSHDLKNELLVNTLSGERARINIYKRSNVVTVQCAPLNLKELDQPASNGVIHVLNKVMLPPSGNVVTALSANKTFSVLVRLVQAAGLVETLSGDRPFTVFAPTNTAFSKLPLGTVEKLLHNPRKLTKILEYHVVAGTFCSSGLCSGPVETVAGLTVELDVSKDGVTVNNAKVINPDKSISNGVVHVIDTVLLPPALLP